MSDKASLFNNRLRRMVFNALMSNNDDHQRNHAHLAKDKDRRLSPAYNLTPAPQISLEHRDLAMACGDYGWIASAHNLLSQSGRFLLEDKEAQHIMNGMVDAVQSSWYTTLKCVGMSEKECYACKFFCLSSFFTS